MKINIIKRTSDTLFLVERINAKNKEIEKIKGENFNIFSILDLKENEVRTHSAFIAELLNPKGSHNLKDTFLLLFLELLQKKKQENESWTKAKIETSNSCNNFIVEKEKYIGVKTETKGGFLDINISSSKMQICIENKINAVETNNQLERYNNYLNTIPKEFKLLIFLTQDGGKSKYNILEKDADYFTLSYKEDIIYWLENCFRVSANYPLIRETIKQYIILVKNITNQINSLEMKEEIHNVIYNNIIGSEIISKEYDNAIDSLSDRFKKDIKERLLLKGVVSHSDDISLKKSNNKYSSIWIKTSGKFIGIESFNGKGHENGALFIGFVDFNRSQPSENYKYHWWLRNTIEIIWNREQLLEKLQIYVNSESEKKNIIIDEVISKVEKLMYIEISNNAPIQVQ